MELQVTGQTDTGAVRKANQDAIDWCVEPSSNQALLVVADGMGGYQGGEVASRIPGGHIFELIEKAYGFDPIQGLILCNDPNATEEEIEAFFPYEVVDAQGYAGCFGVYP